MADKKVIDLAPSELETVVKILNDVVPGRPVWVFGSRATGAARRRSDIDLLIGGAEPISFRQVAELSDAFSESDLPMEVDFIDEAELEGVFKQRVMAESVPLIEISKVAA